MPASDNIEIKKLKKELSQCKRELKEAIQYNERLRSFGFDEIDGWKPQDRIEQQYGWVFAYDYPLYRCLQRHVGETLSPDIRNEIMNTVKAIFAQCAVMGKFGVKLPFDPREVDPRAVVRDAVEPEAFDMDKFLEDPDSMYIKDYVPCEICGEKRITHSCHIIPRVDGGVLHRDNFVILCPLHHHLFDHSRLNEDEWAILSNIINTKMDAAKTYANDVRLPMLKRFWKQSR